MTVSELSTDVSDHFLGLIIYESLQIFDCEFSFGRITDNIVDNC